MIRVLLLMPMLVFGFDHMPECEWGKLCGSHVCHCEGEFHRNLPPNAPDNPDNPRFPRQVCNNSCKKRECCRCSKPEEAAALEHHRGPCPAW